jgi:hypothetical protein
MSEIVLNNAVVRTQNPYTQYPSIYRRERILKIINAVLIIFFAAVIGPIIGLLIVLRVKPIPTSPLDRALISLIQVCTVGLAAFVPFKSDFLARKIVQLF